MQRRNFLGLSFTLVGSSVFATIKKKAELIPASLANIPTFKSTNKLLVLNTKTNVIHFKNPLKTKFKGYIASRNAKELNVATWNTELKSVSIIKSEKDEPIVAHFDKKQSGFILENLALKELSSGISNETLSKATETLSMVFTEPYLKYNSRNWRIYDLTLSLIALNGGITDKWAHYNLITKNLDFSSISIPISKQWVCNEEKFDARVAQCLSSKEENLKRIKNRILIE